MTVKEFNGDLKGFPEEVVEKMLERQVEQGNQRDVEVFEKKKSAGESNGGFDWRETLEGELFWRRVISDYDFECFFALYPKQEPAFPCEMWVWKDDDSDAFKRVVIFKNERGWFALHGIERIDDVDKGIIAIPWPNASIADPRPKAITMAEAEEILSKHFNQKVEIV